jgi:predicted ATPase
VPISDVLSSALLRRMREFNCAERAVLMRASVIGRRFRLTVLTATTGFREDRVRAVLEKACALQVVVQENEPGDWYAFRHALMRDVAYGEFVASCIRPVHRRIARALEESIESSLDDLAYHSWAARDAARCIRYNELAGDRAAAAFATEDAHIYYSRACEFAQPRSEHHRRLTGKLTGLQHDQ